MNAAAQGDQSVSNSDWLGAIQHYTQALVELPRAPIYYTKRSTAYSRVKPADGGPKSSSALHDAEIALTLACERGKRELILAAQMRRGVALYQLGQYGDANFVFETIEKKVGSASGQPKDKSEQVRAAMGSGSTSKYEQELPIWTAKVKGQLKKLGEEDAKAKVSVKEYPSGIQIPTEKDLKEQLAQLKAGKIDTEQKSQSTDKSTAQDAQDASATPATAPAAPAPVNVRHEWYQSNDSVVVTLYAKGIAKDKVDSDLKNDSFNIQFPLPSGADYAFSLDPLFAPIDPSASKVSVLSTKIEITLRKQTPGYKWKTLETNAADVQLTDCPASTATAQAPVASNAPSYPTSSRQGAKNWDKVASELSASQKSGSKKDGGADDADSDLEEGGDNVDAFFKKLYAGADPDTQRAMMKSYVESQGTSLSTNWDEVSKGKVEPKQ